MGEVRVRLISLALFALATCCCFPLQAQAKRVALVIGNSAYKHAPELTNPKNDATDVAAALKGLGIDVIEGMDLDKQGMDRKIRDFSAALAGADAGIFYYAGHGLQVTGTNFLVPVDAELQTADALEFEMVSLDLVQRVMENNAKTNILFLDACRNNPLSRNLARAMGTRAAGIGRGLAPVESGVGTLISFATQPGAVALDGEGRNSPFASALVKHIGTSTDTLTDLLVAIRNDVILATNRQQVPWEHSALTGRFYFKQPPATPGATPAPSPAAEAWDRAKDTSDPAVLEAFLKRYADSFYADLARSRLALLSKPTAAPPPAQSTAQQPVATPAALGDQVDNTAEGLDARLQQTQMWPVVKREFPDWYGERLREAARLSEENQPQVAIAKHLAQALVDLRRKHADEALSASTDKLKHVASAFVDNLKSLSKRSIGVCFGFLSEGETAPAVPEMMLSPEDGKLIQAQVAAIFEAIADGRKSPTTHEPAVKADYDVLVQQLSKLGWNENDLKVFSSPSALSQEPPARICQMVQDWFAAHLAVQDKATQERLLVESLKTVFSG